MVELFFLRRTNFMDQNCLKTIFQKKWSKDNFMGEIFLMSLSSITKLIIIFENDHLTENIIFFSLKRVWKETALFYFRKTILWQTYSRKSYELK